MPKISDSLWPQNLLIPEIVPSWVSVLSKQGEALKELTKGRLYGEVKKGFNSVNKTTYEFYVGVEGAALRYKMLSFDCGLLFDYPVTVRDYEAEAELKIDDEQAFRERLREILNSSETKTLIGRLLAAAR